MHLLNEHSNSPSSTSLETFDDSSEISSIEKITLIFKLLWMGLFYFLAVQHLAGCIISITYYEIAYG